MSSYNSTFIVEKILKRTDYSKDSTYVCILEDNILSSHNDTSIDSRVVLQQLKSTLFNVSQEIEYNQETRMLRFIFDMNDFRQEYSSNDDSRIFTLLHEKIKKYKLN